MLFNSVHFAVFLPIVFVLYWFVTNRSLKWQNLLLLASSYFFYACWDWRFLPLLFFSTFLDYYTGIRMSDARNDMQKKFWFWLSVSVNLGFLGIFKYYNFFAGSFAESISRLGYHVNAWTLKVILPVGISFYTFHGLSYVIDIFKGRIKCEKNFVDYAVFVSFFPLLVAGPIERATHLLPQIQRRRRFDYAQARDGICQIAWGLFKKIAIADTCSIYVDDIFANYAGYSGSTLIFGAVLFSFQIYCDFSGYSEIAIGTAKLFGIDLLTNFRTPYFSRNIAEFWRRWHISLSTWFRDYVYIPLGGSQGSKAKCIRNIFVIFIISGFWHGANWTFLAWGALNAMYFLPSFVLNKNRKYLDNAIKGNLAARLRQLIEIGYTFAITTFAWIFFRSRTMADALSYIGRIFRRGNFSGMHAASTYARDIRPLAVYLAFFLVIEWYYKNDRFVFADGGNSFSYRIPRYAIYALTVIFIILSIKNQAATFIYFQF